MSGPVSFPTSLDFGSATYGDAITREVSVEKVSEAASVTATITSDGLPYTTKLVAYDTSMQPVSPSKLPPGFKGPPPTYEVYTETGSSDGTVPLAVAKGQALFVYVMLTVPDRSVMPGPTAAKLMIKGDAWGASTVSVTAELVSVDEYSYIGVKWVEAGGLAASGAVTANAELMPDGVGSFQEFANATIFYSPDFGAALISRALYSKLNSRSVAAGKTADGESIRDYLGYPTGDSFATQEDGGQAAYFEKGMIVSRASQQAFVVYGPIYQHYRGLGSVAQGAGNLPVVGLPASDEEASPNGRLSHFDGGDIYWNSDTGAWEVHGAIRERWLTLGGPSGLLGYPTSDEMPVMDGATQVGRYNTFQGGVRGSFPTGQARIYCSDPTNAWEVYGDIKDVWLQSGGPTGPLGFPLSGETDTPGGGRFNSFEHGVVVSLSDGPFEGTFPVQGVQLDLLSYADSAQEDFNVQINITDSTGQVNHGRMPSSDNYHNGNQQFTLPVNLMGVVAVTAGYTLDVWMLCVHENTIGKDEEDGTVTAHFDIDNVWGTVGPSSYTDGAFTVAMKPIPEPQVVATDPSLFRKNLFWPFKNFDTDPLTWQTYSETFADVGAADKDFDLGTALPWNWYLFERVFFELVYSSAAKPGNCFGMCLESIYARELLTLFVEPIFSSPFNTYRKDGQEPDPGSPGDAAAVQQVNIKHGYQLGAGLIEWFLGKWTAGALHDPVRAFRESRDAFARGDWPILTISSDGELSQTGHMVVPYRWDPPTEDAINSQPLSSQTWTIYVANPNDPLADDGYPECKITIDPFHPSFAFDMGDGSTWTGTDSSGGRLLTIPFSQLNSQPVTPGDAIFALLAGGIVILMAGDGQTSQVTDEFGRTYYSYGRGGTEALTLGGSVSPSSMKAEQLMSVNPDPKTRVPGMMSVPLNGSQLRPGTDPLRPEGDAAGGGILGRVQDASVHKVPLRAAVADQLLPSFQFYYVKRPSPGFTWATPLGFTDVGDARVKAVAMASEATPAHVPRAASRAPPGSELRSAASSLSPSPGTTSASSTMREIAGQAHPQLTKDALPQPTLTFQAKGLRDGSYEWAVFSPRMSVHISAQTAAEAIDTITLGQAGTGGQTVSLRPDGNLQARKFTISVGGWRGDQAPQVRSYVLENLTVGPGQSLTASVNDGGRELLLSNPGEATTFDLTIYAGAGTQAMAARPNVTVEAGATARIRPSDWSQASLSESPIAMDILDGTGKLIRQVNL